MSGTYSDPKGSKWHTPGKVDYSPSSKEVLVDGNNRPTKIGAEVLKNGNLGEATRGDDQIVIAPTPRAEASDKTPPKQSAPKSPIKDERLDTSDAKNSKTQTELTPEREQRQYPDGNEPNSG